MFKKLLSLYGLCFFNLGATLGEYLTQCELEEFLCHYRDGAEATWDVVFVNVRAPEMPKFWTPGEWKKTIEKFVSFDEQVNGFYLGLSYEDLIGKECIYKTITLKTPEAIAAWSELTKNKDAEIKSLCTSETVASEPPCKTKRTDPRTPFFKYSRPLESGKKSVFDEWYKQQFPGSGIPNVRIIDYESILAGFPELKEEADRLMDSLKTDDQKYLRDAIRAKWFNEQKPILVRIQIISGSEETYTEFLYKPNLSVLDSFINRLYYTLGHRETVYQQTLVLTLLLSKNLRFVIDNTEGEVGCYRTGNDTLSLNLPEGWLDRALIYHELNHALHCYLGMVGAFFESNETCNALQKKLLFQYSEEETIPEKSYNIKPGWFRQLFCYQQKVDTEVSISLKNLYRALEIALLWGNDEELWNVIGFMQIGDTICINRLSDINFNEKPGIFYPAPVVIFYDYGSKFDDFVKKCCPSLAASRKDYQSLAFFCNDLEIDRDSDSCIISRENLNLLLFLQNRNLDTVFVLVKRYDELTGSIWDSLEI